MESLKSAHRDLQTNFSSTTAAAVTLRGQISDLAQQVSERDKSLGASVAQVRKLDQDVANLQSNPVYLRGRGR